MPNCSLEPVGGAAPRHGHDPGVVHEHVEPVDRGGDGRRPRPAPMRGRRGRGGRPRGPARWRPRPTAARAASARSGLRQPSSDAWRRAAASASADRRPSPLLAPVTRTVRPVWSGMSVAAQRAHPLSLPAPSGTAPPPAPRRPGPTRRGPATPGRGPRRRRSGRRGRRRPARWTAGPGRRPGARPGSSSSGTTMPRQQQQRHEERVGDGQRHERRQPPGHHEGQAGERGDGRGRRPPPAAPARRRGASPAPGRRPPAPPTCRAMTTRTASGLGRHQPGAPERRGPEPLEHAVGALEAGGDGQVDHRGRRSRRGPGCPGPGSRRRRPRWAARRRGEKKTSSATGMPSVSSSDSPLRKVSVSSTRSWAASALTAGPRR